MNQFELENKIQLKSDKYVLDLEKRYGPSEIKDTVITFLKSKPLKYLLLESSDTSASAWKLLQCLKELQCLSNLMISSDYLESQNLTMVKWGEIVEILRSSKAFPKLKNLTAFEFDKSVKSFDEKLINTIIQRIGVTINKKIIFIISSKKKVFFENVKSDSIIYYNESKNTVMPIYDFNTKSLIKQASIGNVSAVKEILDNGVDVNGTLPDGTTALHKAATNGCRDVAVVLLNNRSNHLPDGKKYAPLHCAAKGGHVDIVELFLENDADSNIKGYSGRTALHYAAKFGNKDLVLTLLKHGARLLPDIHKDTPLHYAAENGQQDVVKLFLENNVDVNIKGSCKRTALHYAAKCGHRDLVLILLKQGAKHLPNQNKDTPLHDAARNGHQDVVKLFLENNVDVNIRGSFEQTALHYAAEFGHKDLVLTLLKHGAKHLPDQYKDTPLHSAAKKGHGDIVKLFIENNVDVNIKGFFEQTALHYAAEFGHRDLVLTLLKHGAKNLPRQNKDTPLHTAARKCREEVVNLLLENDVDVNAKGFCGMTALLIAVKEGYTNIIDTLVKKGADINIKNDYGNTALDLARNRKYIIKHLTKEEQGKN